MDKFEQLAEEAKVDWQGVRGIVGQAYQDMGYVVTDPATGEQVLSDARLAQAGYETMLARHVVTGSASDRVAKGAATKHELYSEVFPKGPAVSAQPASVEERHAREYLRNKVWKLAATGINGSVNKRLGLEGKTLVMCETDVERTAKSEETGITEPTDKRGRFLTDDGALIQRYSLVPLIEKRQKAVDSLAKHAVMVTERHPEITANVQRQLTGFVKKASVTLTAALVTKAGAEQPDAE
jgi:hypothetical protein